MNVLAAVTVLLGAGLTTYAWLPWSLIAVLAVGLWYFRGRRPPE